MATTAAPVGRPDVAVPSVRLGERRASAVVGLLQWGWRTCELTTIDRTRFDVPLYTVAEAARIVAVPPTTVATWTKVDVRRAGRSAVAGEPVITWVPAARPSEPCIPFVGLAEALVLSAIRRSGVEPVETHLREGETIDAAADLVARGWPLDVDGLLRNADATRSRFSWRGEPLIAISAEVSIEGWSLDAILAGPRLRTRSRYARATVSDLVAAGFELLPTFVAPHHSVVLPSYDVASAQRLLDVLGELQRNPFYVGRQP